MFFIVFRMRSMFNDLFMFQTLCSYTRISSLPYSRFLPVTLGYEFSEVHVLNNWSYLCKVLATLTTIATPTYSAGVGIFGDVGCLLGPLFIIFFTSMIQTCFMLLLFIRFAITHAAILFSKGRVRYYALTDSLHVLKLIGSDCIAFEID